MKKLKGIAKVQMAKLRRCYVYEIRVDGVIRYIGKGCNDRINSHLIEARRTASRSEVKIRNLSSPRSSRQGASSAIDDLASDYRTRGRATRAAVSTPLQ